MTDDIEVMKRGQKFTKIKEINKKNSESKKYEFAAFINTRGRPAVEI
jgi:hypothetical protein